MDLNSGLQITNSASGQNVTFFNREKKNNKNKNDKHDALINKVNVHIKANIWTGAVSLTVFTVLRLIRLINYRLIIRTFKRASCFSWVQVFENTCTNHNLANELRRRLDRNRILLMIIVIIIKWAYTLQGKSNFPYCFFCLAVRLQRLMYLRTLEQIKR